MQSGFRGLTRERADGCKASLGREEKVASASIHTTNYEQAPAGVGTPGAVQQPMRAGTTVSGGQREQRR